MDPAWITLSPSAMLGVGLNALGIYVILIVLTRLVGLRSFSKMSSFDFAITVAIGSVIASTVSTKDPSLLQGGFALAVLFGIQWIFALARKRISGVEDIVDNDPILVMVGDKMLEENMKVAHMTRSDLTAKLREANVLDFREIRAVVVESTGDVSVLHGDPEGRDLNSDLLKDVRGREHLTSQ